MGDVGFEGVVDAEVRREVGVGAVQEEGVDVGLLLRITGGGEREVLE